MLYLYVSTVEKLRGFANNKKGQGMVEYGLIIALIAVVVMVALTPLGTKVRDMFTNVSNKF